MFALVFSVAALNLVAMEAPLPNPVAPFQVLKGKRLDPVLKVGTFVSEGKTYSQPRLVIGNKRISPSANSERTVHHDPASMEQFVLRFSKCFLVSSARY